MQILADINPDSNLEELRVQFSRAADEAQQRQHQFDKYKQWMHYGTVVCTLAAIGLALVTAAPFGFILVLGKAVSIFNILLCGLVIAAPILMNASIEFVKIQNTAFDETFLMHRKAARIQSILDRTLPNNFYNKNFAAREFDEMNDYVTLQEKKNAIKTHIANYNTFMVVYASVIIGLMIPPLFVPSLILPFALLAVVKLGINKTQQYHRDVQHGELCKLTREQIKDREKRYLTPSTPNLRLV